MEEMLIELGITFVICLLGAICKDYYNTLIKAEPCVQIPRILLSAITGTIVIYSLDIKNKVGDRMFVLVCYGGGILGLDLFSKIKGLDIDKLIDTYKGLKK
jgi:hypothetical protein